MTELVTIEEAREHLRLDADADDPWLAIFIPAVSEAVLGWLKDSWRAYVLATDSNGDPVDDSNGDPVPAVDSDGNLTPRWSVKAAVLVELASLYRYREGEGDNQVDSSAGHGYTLSRAAVALLTPLRKPSAA